MKTEIKTYRELKEVLDKMTQEQLNQEITVLGEFAPISITSVEVLDDALYADEEDELLWTKEEYVNANGNEEELSLIFDKGTVILNGDECN